MIQMELILCKKNKKKTNKKLKEYKEMETYTTYGKDRTYNTLS